MSAMTFANGNSFSRGGNEQECALIRRLLQVAEDRR
jgi:hypothetical protein